MKASLSKPNTPWGEARKNGSTCKLTRNEHRFFKDYGSMNDDVKNQPTKITYTLPTAKRDEFYRSVKKSGKSRNKYITDRIFTDDSIKELLVKLLNENGQLRHEVQTKGLASDGIAHELRLIRTCLMSALGRQS